MEEGPVCRFEKREFVANLQRSLSVLLRAPEDRERNRSHYVRGYQSGCRGLLKKTSSL